MAIIKNTKDQPIQLSAASFLPTDNSSAIRVEKVGVVEITANDAFAVVDRLPTSLRLQALATPLQTGVDTGKLYAITFVLKAAAPGLWKPATVQVKYAGRTLELSHSAAICVAPDKTPAC